MPGWLIGLVLLLAFMGLMSAFGVLWGVWP